MAVYIRKYSNPRQDVVLNSDGVGNASMGVTSAIRFSNSTFLFPHYTIWNDLPYGTPRTSPTHQNATGATGVNAQLVGKNSLFSANSPPNGLNRSRLGVSFSMPSLTDLVSVVLHIEFILFSNALESFNPVVWASNTGDTSVNSSWYLNLNNFAGTGFYNKVGDQAIPLNPGAIIGRSGSILSLIIGEPQELNGSGAGGNNVNNSGAKFAWSSANFTPFLTLGFSS